MMPTLPMTATPLPAADAPISEIIQRAFEILPNTAPFDCSHHPAMSVPCGMVDGLPVGMMLVGKPYAEQTIYRAAAAFERGVDWKTHQGVNSGAFPADHKALPGMLFRAWRKAQSLEQSWWSDFHRTCNLTHSPKPLDQRWNLVSRPRSAEKVTLNLITSFFPQAV